jgi:hypothetical protein
MNDPTSGREVLSKSKIDNIAISRLASTNYDTHTRQIRCSTPVQLELANWCFENDRNMSVTIANAVLEFLQRNGHDWSDSDMRDIMEGAEVTA